MPAPAHVSPPARAVATVAAPAISPQQTKVLGLDLFKGDGSLSNCVGPKGWKKDCQEQTHYSKLNTAAINNKKLLYVYVFTDTILPSGKTSDENTFIAGYEQGDPYVDGRGTKAVELTTIRLDEQKQVVGRLGKKVVGLATFYQ